ncbi:MAG: hypothetical protein CL840_11600 [Crocinitomicaceae bacterium]|nr:hypothetical protein [Crocinitomicaceae bacterium]|tara:strand:- start:6692 stop:8260 length:1569 start_codon:yes stop_codon:yes gene_type:complete
MVKLLRSNWFLSILCALLLKLSWIPADVSFLFFVAFIPLLHLLVKQKRVLHSFLYSFLTFFLILLLLHIDFLQYVEGKKILWVALAFLVIPFFWSIPSFVFSYVRIKRGIKSALLVFPFLFVAQEVFQYYWEFPVTWFHLGYGISNSNWLTAGYPYYGSEGGSFLIIGINCCFYYLWAGKKAESKYWKRLSPLVLLVALLIGPLFFRIPGKQGKEIKIGMFQPSHELMDSIGENVDAQVSLLESIYVDSLKGSLDLLICPESFLVEVENNPIFTNSIDRNKVIQRLKNLSTKIDAPILSGAILIKLYNSKDYPTPSAKKKEEGVYYDIINGSVFITPNGKVDWKSKQWLVPMYEAIPFHGLINSLSDIFGAEVRFNNTYGVVPTSRGYKYKDLNIAAPICYESLFPNLVSSYVRRSTNLIVILSTYWTRSEVLKQGYTNHSKMTAKSFQKSIAFAALDEESAIINQNGNVIRSNGELFWIQYINLSAGVTTYALISRWLWVWITISFIVLFVILMRKKGEEK